MLLTRLVTALILVPLVFLAVLYLDSRAFDLLLGVVVLAACWELTRLTGLESLPGRVSTVFFMGLVLWLLYRFQQAPWVPFYLLALGGWWMINLVMLLLGRIRFGKVQGFRP
ncbi:MAG TPA: hypothetical protein EYP90_02540, partial [Chromatiaceae bacterium]|nr:hypothetical protein [Chromatiaceae bacterium]